MKKSLIVAATLLATASFARRANNQPSNRPQKTTGQVSSNGIDSTPHQTGQ
jgi:hypothetical protein